MLIRPGTEADLTAIVDLYNAFAHTIWEYTETLHTVSERRAWLAEQQATGFPVLVAVDDGEIVRFASYGAFRDTARWPGYRFTVEHTIHVAEDHWHRGIGRALISALAERARQDGIRVMVAGIDSTNSGSIAFHARLGFQETARMPGVGDKWGQRLELVLMQFDLSEPLR